MGKMTLKAVESLATESCGLSQTDVKVMLDFMHHLGVVVHFGVSDSPVLQSLVVLHP